MNYKCTDLIPSCTNRFTVSKYQFCTCIYLSFDPTCDWIDDLPHSRQPHYDYTTDVFHIELYLDFTIHKIFIIQSSNLI